MPSRSRIESTALVGIIGRFPWERFCCTCCRLLLACSCSFAHIKRANESATLLVECAGCIWILTFSPRAHVIDCATSRGRLWNCRSSPQRSYDDDYTSSHHACFKPLVFYCSGDLCSDSLLGCHLESRCHIVISRLSETGVPERQPAGNLVSQRYSKEGEKQRWWWIAATPGLVAWRESSSIQLILYLVGLKGPDLPLARVVLLPKQRRDAESGHRGVGRSEEALCWEAG